MSRDLALGSSLDVSEGENIKTTITEVSELPIDIQGYNLQGKTIDITLKDNSILATNKDSLNLPETREVNSSAITNDKEE